MSEVRNLLDEVLAEWERAEAKYPVEGNPLYAALATEVGELGQELLKGTPERARREAIQVAVVALRIAVHGDLTIDFWARKKAS